MGVEQETREFFIKIANSIAIVLLWMIANVLIGIYFEWGFYETNPRWQNIVYYILSLFTLFLVIMHLRKKWR